MRACYHYQAQHFVSGILYCIDDYALLLHGAADVLSEVDTFLVL
jgi:hypothetical protein